MRYKYLVYMTCILQKSVTWKLSWKGMEEKRWQILSFLTKWREVQMLFLWCVEDCLRQDSNLKNFRFYNQILSSKTGLIHNNILNQLRICIWSEKKCSSPCLLSCDPWFSHVPDIFSNLPILVHKAHSKRDLLHPYLVAKMCRVGTKKKIYFSWTVHFHWCGSNVFKLVQFLFQP